MHRLGCSGHVRRKCEESACGQHRTNRTVRAKRAKRGREIASAQPKGGSLETCSRPKSKVGVLVGGIFLLGVSTMKLKTTYSE